MLRRFHSPAVNFWMLATAGFSALPQANPAHLRGDRVIPIREEYPVVWWQSHQTTGYF